MRETTVLHPETEVLDRYASILGIPKESLPARIRECDGREIVKQCHIRYLGGTLTQGVPSGPTEPLEVPSWMLYEAHGRLGLPGGMEAARALLAASLPHFLDRLSSSMRKDGQPDDVELRR